jgi:DNA-binding NarL/FixJ family response regulator
LLEYFAMIKSKKGNRQMKTLKKINPGDALAKLGTVPVYMLMPVTAQTTIGQLMQADRLVCEVEVEAEAKTEPKHRQAEKPKATKSKLGTVDHDAIIELHKAGRSVASIGMELHCTDQTVRNHIDKAKTEGAIQ